MQCACVRVGGLITGPAPRNAGYVFLTKGVIPHQFMNCADCVRIFRKSYCVCFWMIAPKSTSRALAIFMQLSRVGLRLPFSIKLMDARLRPVSVASFSCDSSLSLRTCIRSFKIRAASCSDFLSLIIKNNQILALAFIRNYSNQGWRFT